jgi:hypothetical protein
MGKTKIKKTALRMAGFNINYDREKDDFYTTPPEATQSLLNKEKFVGNVLEPACGIGTMSEILIKNGYDVVASDLVDRGYGKTGIDFLKTTEQYDNVITNPPFILASNFILHSFKIARKKVAIFGKLTALEGVKRKEIIYSQKKLKKVLVFTRRVSFTKPDSNKVAGGLIAFAWYIFDLDYNGLPQVDWI